MFLGRRHFFQNMDFLVERNFWAAADFRWGVALCLIVALMRWDESGVATLLLFSTHYLLGLLFSLVLEIAGLGAAVFAMIFLNFQRWGRLDGEDSLHTTHVL